MNLINSLRINLRKLSKYKQKSLFLILPIIILMILSIIVTSEATNIQQAAEKSVFGTIAESNRLIELSKNSEFFSSPGGGSRGAVSFSLDSSDDSNYKESDLDKINAITHVEDSAIVSALPVSNVKAVGLFDGINFNLGQLAGLESGLASQYTDQSFEYKEGEAIPIVLNAQTLVEIYEDWQGKDSIEINFASQARRGQGPASIEESGFPVKNRAIDYDKEDLIGKEFTLTVGGLTDFATYKTEPTDSGIKFTKYTQAELDAQEQARKDALSPYWNYGLIKKPLEIKVKVVGVIESDSQFFSFIPQDYANKLMHDYLQNEIDARTATAIPTDDLNQKFNGAVFDGLEFKQDPFSSFRIGRAGGGAVRIMGGPGGVSPDSSSDSYDIPGLVIETNRDGDEVKGEYRNADVYAQTPETGSLILMKVDNALNRSEVVKSLNSTGFAYQDLVNMGVIDELKATLNNVVLLVAIGFVAFSIMVIIFTMGKFVSESRREIGIFRALGATRGEIRQLFISQALLYVAFGYIVGAVIGLASIIGLASVMHGAFDNFIGKTLKETFSVVSPVGSEVFMQINWEAFALFSAALLVITIVTSLIPATAAANVSPVEAIRGE
jgi:hypothetical protein